MLSFCLNGPSERTAYRFISIIGIELIRRMAAIVLMVLQETKAVRWISGVFGQTAEELCWEPFC